MEESEEQNAGVAEPKAANATPCAKEVAVKKGFITSEEFVHALEKQVIEEIEDGHLRSIATILLEKGCITSHQIDDIFETLT